jgi:long-subunit fatty acid transport protein
VGTQVSHGGKSSTRLLPGVFSSVGLAWHLTDQFSIQGSVRYQFMRQYSLMANGSNANLSFDSAMVLSLGAMYRF